MYGSNNDSVTGCSTPGSGMGTQDKETCNSKLCYVGMLLHTAQHKRIFTDEEVYDILGAPTRFEEVQRARFSPSPSDFRQTYSYGKRRCVHCTEMDIQECAIPRTLYGNTRSCDECTTVGIECSYNPNNSSSHVKHKSKSPVRDLEEESRLYESNRKFLIAFMP